MVKYRCLRQHQRQLVLPSLLRAWTATTQFYWIAEVHNWHFKACAECSMQRSPRHKLSQVRMTMACRVYFMISYTSSTSPSESSTRSLSWFVGVWRTKRRLTWATTGLDPLIAINSRHLRSPASISWLLCKLHLPVGFSLLWTRRSGTHYRLSFVICLSVLVTNY